MKNLSTVTVKNYVFRSLNTTPPEDSMISTATCSERGKSNCNAATSQPNAPAKLCKPHSLSLGWMQQPFQKCPVIRRNLKRKTTLSSFPSNSDPAKRNCNLFLTFKVTLLTNKPPQRNGNGILSGGNNLQKIK